MLVNIPYMDHMGYERILLGYLGTRSWAQSHRLQRSDGVLRCQERRKANALCQGRPCHSTTTWFSGCPKSPKSKTWIEGSMKFNEGTVIKKENDKILAFKPMTNRKEFHLGIPWLSISQQSGTQLSIAKWHSSIDCCLWQQHWRDVHQSQDLLLQHPNRKFKACKQLDSASLSCQTKKSRSNYKWTVIVSCIHSCFMLFHRFHVLIIFNLISWTYGPGLTLKLLILLAAPRSVHSRYMMEREMPSGTATLSDRTNSNCAAWIRVRSWAILNQYGFVWRCWVNIPNEIAIFHRDNDQQNHWVQWGTQHFQTHPYESM